MDESTLNFFKFGLDGINFTMNILEYIQMITNKKDFSLKEWIA